MWSRSFCGMGSPASGRWPHSGTGSVSATTSRGLRSPSPPACERPGPESGRPSGTTPEMAGPEPAWHGGAMTESTHRSVTVERLEAGRFAAVNSRGGRIAFGTGGDDEFTPTELLLAAIGGWTANYIDMPTSPPAAPT